MKRLGYTKSRKGCLRCKQRRVKCDEEAPCAACRRHDLICSLSLISQDDSPVSALDSKSPSSASPARSQPRSANDAPCPDLQRIFRNLGTTGESDADPENQTAFDLELMHHYTSKAYCTFSNSARVNEALQYDVPREAFSEASLFHQLMAFAAFHLAYLHPNHRQRYLVHAYKHQDKAFERVTSVLNNELTRENCHGVYATSIFLIICAFATLPCTEISDLKFKPIDSLVEIFTLMAGMAAILTSSDKELRAGPLKQIFSDPNIRAQPSDQLKKVAIRLTETKERLVNSGWDSHDANWSQSIDAATALIETLDVAVGLRSATSAELRAVFVWPLKLTPSYLELLQRRHPCALVVLAYYSVLLFYGEEVCWFLGKWAENLLLGIQEQLHSTPYYDMLEWPVSVVCPKSV